MIGSMSSAIAVSARSIALVCAATVLLSGCSWGASPTLGSTVPVESTAPVAPTSQVAGSPTPSPEPTMAADDSRSPASSPTGIEPGNAVLPEFFISEIDRGNGEYFAVIYVRGIFEDGGSCSVTVEANGRTYTQENVAEVDTSGTACGSFAFPLSQLGSGEATVIARYESVDHQGETDEVKVVLP